MIRACLCLLAGEYALQLNSFVAGSDLITVALVAVCLLPLVRGLPALVAFLIGAMLFALAGAAVVDSRLAPRFAGDSIVTRVRVSDFPRRRGKALAFLARPLGAGDLPDRVRLSWYDPPAGVEFGDVWQLEVRLRRPRGSRNPGTFDFEAWAFRERLGALGYVVGGRRNHLLHSGDLGIVDRVRRRFVNRVTALFPDGATAGVLAAVCVGARHLIDADQWSRYGRTGTSHLMAISGLHIGLAAAGGYLLASLVSGLALRRGNHHLRATVLALLVAVTYALVSGLAVPALRAGLMACVAAACLVRRRRPQALRVVAAVCLLLAVLQPLSTMAPGFKLSFAAVLVLLWLARRSRGSVARGLPGRFAAAGCLLGRMQILLLFGLAPLTVLEFHRVAFAAPLVNLVAVPVFSVVTVPFGLAGLVLDGPLHVLGDAALGVAAVSVDAVESLIVTASRWPGAAYPVPGGTGMARAWLLLPLLLVLMPPGWPGRGLAWLGFAALVLGATPRPRDGCADVDVLDVGQGLAVIARTHDHTLVYDTGSAYRSGGSAVESVLLPFLAHAGIRRVDTLVVSHADLDHAGGVMPLLAGITVHDIFVGETLPGLTRHCRDGMHWEADGVAFRFLYPGPGPVPVGNDASCVLSLEAGQHRLLLTGDIGKAAERAMLARDAVPRADVIVVPHHGSRTSSTAGFVRAVSPRLAIVSAGFGNHWGLPKSDVVARWRASGARVLDTATSGDVAVRICADDGLESVVGQRNARHRIWHE
jgi:competence protein ComEC